jgi:hypothetical protein
MFSLLFLATWSVTGRSGVAATASILALVAPSFEGLYEIGDFLRRGVPLSRLTDVNIDALTAWDFPRSPDRRARPLDVVHAAAHDVVRAGPDRRHRLDSPGGPRAGRSRTSSQGSRSDCL